MSFASIKNKEQKNKKLEPKAFSFLLHQRACLKEAAGSDVLLITKRRSLDADRRGIVLEVWKICTDPPVGKIFCDVLGVFCW